MKAVQNVSTIINTDKSDLYNVYGTEITGYKVLPFTDANFNNYSASHTWTLVGMYNQISSNLRNKSVTEGGLLDTSFYNIPNAFLNDGMVLLSLNNDTYREKINAYDFAIKIPLDSSYTGMTSGLTATTLYTSFIWDKDCLSTNPTELCAGTIQDSKTSESSVRWTNDIGIGNKFVNGVNPIAPPNLFDSGVAYLVTDSVYLTFTGGTASTMSWSSGFGLPNKYAKNAARSINPSFSQTQYPGTYDVVVGMVDINAGIVCIWNNNLVQGFNWSGFTGDPLTGATTTSGNTYAVIGDMDTSVSVSIDIMAEPGEWNYTTNPSMNGQNNCGTVVTKICLYDEVGNLMAIGVPDEAIAVPPNKYTNLNLVADISGSIDQTGIWATRGVTLNP